MDDGHNVMTLHHMPIYVRWAKKHIPLTLSLRFALCLQEAIIYSNKIKLSFSVYP